MLRSTGSQRAGHDGAPEPRRHRHRAHCGWDPVSGGSLQQPPQHSRCSRTGCCPVTVRAPQGVAEPQAGPCAGGQPRGAHIRSWRSRWQQRSPICRSERGQISETSGGREATGKCSQGARHVSPLDTLGQAILTNPRCSGLAVPPVEGGRPGPLPPRPGSLAMMTGGWWDPP